jgi:hypothetical protein
MNSNVPVHLTVLLLYSSLCRQVVTNDEDMLNVLNIDGPYASLTFTATNDANVAIVSVRLFNSVKIYNLLVQFQESVYAIPYDQWHVGYIQPKLKCIRQNQEYVQLCISFLPTVLINLSCNPGAFCHLSTTQLVLFKLKLKLERMRIWSQMIFLLWLMSPSKSLS